MRILFFILFSCSALLSYSQIKFPEADLDKGYINAREIARIAFPLKGQARVWIKGSSEHSIARICDTKTSKLITSVELSPPFYTDVIPVTWGTLKVSFCNTTNDCTQPIILDTAHYKQVDDGNFSLLVYGCLEPFEVTTEDGKLKSRIFEGENNSSFRIRRLFQNLAIEQKVVFRDSLHKKNKYAQKGTFDSLLLIGRPKAILTTGDQVYVDAGYDSRIKKGNVHPISAWETKRRPQPLIKSDSAYQSFLNSIYRASYSFSQIETAHRRLPLLPAIDDHELRDGWGSQGDEYNDGILNPQLAPYFILGKEAFVEHQLLLSKFSKEEARERLPVNRTLDYSFTINGKNGYVFDLRSARNINERKILGEAEWERFKFWLANLKEDQEIILVTSVPLTLRPLKWIEDIYKLFKPELRDDARDGWNSRKSKEDRDRLLKLLTTYRIERNIKPIFVSGDIHKSALIEIWIDTDVGRNGKLDAKEAMILGYEVVASGISHEFIKTGISRKIFKLFESQRIGDGLIEFDYFDKRASIYPMVKKSIVAQNFAALEFSETEATKIHTFLYNHNTESLEQHYLQLDFDKKIPHDDSSNKLLSKNDFGKREAEGYRIILDDSDKE